MTSTVNVKTKAKFFKRETGLLIPIASIAVFGVLLVYPVARMFVGTLEGSTGGFFETLAIYPELFQVGTYREAIYNSLILATSATLGATVVGVSLAYVTRRFNIPGKLLIRVAVIMVLIAPPFIGAYSWILLLGSRGIVTRAFSAIDISLPQITGWPGLLLVLTIQGTPFVFLMTSAALNNVDQSIEDASINLGKSRWVTFFRAIAPLLKGGVSTGMLLVFVTAFADFGTPAIIGRNVRTFPTLVYDSFVSETSGGDYRRAGALSIIMISICVIALLIQRSYAKRNAFELSTVRPLQTVVLRGFQRLAATLFAYVIVAISVLPLVVVVVTSFMRTEFQVLVADWNLDAYSFDLPIWAHLGNSVKYTSIATIVCAVVGLLIGFAVARSKGPLSSVVDILSMMPYAVAGVVMGIAFGMAFGGSPFFLASTSTILVLVYIARRLPYSVRAVSSVLRQTGTDVEEASVNLGVSPWATFWRVTVPLILPGILSGALLTWSTVVREFNATAILYGPSTTTATIDVFSNVTYGRFAMASASGTLIMLVSLIPIILLFRIFGKDEEFLI